MTLEDAQVVARPQEQRELLCALMLGYAALCLVGVIVLPSWLRLFSFLYCVAFLLLAHRYWRLRVLLGEGVTVVNVLRTVHLPWSDIDRFEQSWNGAVWVRHRSGRRTRVTAFGSVRRDLLRQIRQQNDEGFAVLHAALLARRAGRS